MKIRMLVGIAGTDFSVAASEETERFSAAEAARLIESGQAVPVRASAVETAVAAPVVERAVVAPVSPVASIRAVAVHRGRGSYSVMVDGVETVEGLSKQDAAEFNAFTDEAKADFISARKG